MKVSALYENPLTGLTLTLTRGRLTIEQVIGLKKLGQFNSQLTNS